jgi:hypothetical protein
VPTHAVGLDVPVEEVRAVLPRVRIGGYLLATGPGGAALLPDPPRSRWGRLGERRARRLARDLAVELAAPAWHLLDQPGVTRATLVTPAGAAASLDWPAHGRGRPQVLPPAESGEPGPVRAERQAAHRAEWERRCARLATMAGRPEQGAALAELGRELAVLRSEPAAPGDEPAFGGGRADGEQLLAGLCELFGLPRQLVGQSLLAQAAAHGHGAVRFEGRC